MSSEQGSRNKLSKNPDADYLSVKISG